MKQLSAGRGTPGCKNIRLGGDTIKPSGEKPVAHMVYMVYRSFKFKPTWYVQIYINGVQLFMYRCTHAYVGMHVPIQKKILEMWCRRVFRVCFDARECTGQVKKVESAVWCKLAQKLQRVFWCWSMKSWTTSLVQSDVSCQKYSETIPLNPSHISPPSLGPVRLQHSDPFWGLDLPSFNPSCQKHSGRHRWEICFV